MDGLPTSKVKVRGELGKKVDPPGADGIKVCLRAEGVQSSQATEGPDMNRIVVGVDYRKGGFFQLHWVEARKRARIVALQL